MGQENTKIHKIQKKSNNNRFTFILIAAIFVVYFIMQIIAAFSNNIETVTAAKVTINNSFTATGWIFRNEVIVQESETQTAKHIVSNGERVQQDAPLAIIYADEQALNTSKQLEAINNRISWLDAALSSANDGSDATKLDQLLILSFQQMSEQIKGGSSASIAATADSVRTLSLRRSAAELDISAIATEKNNLLTQKESLTAELSGKNKEITAPVSGYFSEVLDGYEEKLSISALDELSLDTFHDLIKAEDITNKNSLGKVMQGFSWYVAAEVPAQKIEELKIGQSMRINFTLASIEAPVIIHDIIKEKDSETALLILEGNEFNGELISIRSQPVELIIATYTGLQIPKEAARMEESQLGVLILSGSVPRFKKITPIYEADTFYVIEQSATDVDSVVAQDEIIVKGKGLQNNMVVK